MKFFDVIDCTYCWRKGTSEIKLRGWEIKSAVYIATCNNFKMKLYSTHLLGLCDEHNVQQTLVYTVIVVHCLNSLRMLHNERQWRVKKWENKNLLGYLFHPLTTVRFHSTIILYHLFQSSLEMPEVKKLPLGYYSQLDRSQYEETFPNTNHSCFPLKCHCITPGHQP